MIRAVLVGLVVTVTLLGLGALRRRYVLVTVTGNSMLPTLAAGDRVVVRRVRPARIRPGHLVVASRPSAGRRWRDPGPPVAGTPWLIKRVSAAGSPPGTMILLGDNAVSSWDSRQWGPCPVDRLLGVVVAVLRRR
jgi:signal peptidase I